IHDALCPDLAVADNRIRPDLAVRPDHRFADDVGVGVNHGVLADAGILVNVSGGRVDQGHAFQHPVLVDTAAQRGLGFGQMNTSVDADHLVQVVVLHANHGQALTGGQRSQIGQI